MTDKILMIDSRSYSGQRSDQRIGQNPNDLTVYLDEEMDSVEGMRIIFLGIPCTFYNIAHELGNNNLLIHDGSSWRYIRISDGWYDMRTFNREVATQMRKLGLDPRGLRFDLHVTTGKMAISFLKLTKRGRKYTYKLSITKYNKDLFGFDEGSELPRRMRDPTNPSKIIHEEISIGQRPANFKPFEYYHIHCDLIDTGSVSYNGKRSDLLVRIPVKECTFGELSIQYLTGLRDRKCTKKFNKLRLWITDENDKPINFNGGNIQYELLFRRSDEEERSG